MPLGDRPRARRLRRVLGLALGLALLALCLEAALRREARDDPAHRRSRLEAWAAGPERVLALGDSNTYGGDETYPRILERLWNADPARAPIRVLNLGFPGMNTSLVRRDFARMLRVFRPDTVTYMVGTNDFWTVPHPPGPREPARAKLETWLFAHSQLYRLLERAWRARRPEPALEVETDMADRFGFGKGSFRYGGARFDFDFAMSAAGGTDYPDARGRSDLRKILRAARHAGVRVVLVTYPLERHFLSVANLRLREIAAETGTELVDLAASFRADCPADGCLHLFRADEHLSPEGHEVAARKLVAALAPKD